MASEGGCISMVRRFWRVFGGGQILLATLISEVTAVHGTYIAAGGNADHIAVAIDSRITGDNKAGQTIFDDHYCKILPLSDSTIFFSTGVNGLRDIYGHTIFDAEETAQKVYNDEPRGRFQELSSLWASLMMENYKVYSTQLVILSNPLIEGCFAGANTDGAFGIYGQRIFGTPAEPSAEPLNYDINSDKFFEMASSPDILREFANGGTTDRARVALQLLGLEARGKSPTVSTALLFEIMVTVARQSGNPHIGGETAVMMMERSAPIWRWFHRPPYCPTT
jgi:hypothetical protein